MRLFWIVLLGMLRAGYLLYSLLCLATPILAIAILVVDWNAGPEAAINLIRLTALATLVIAIVVSLALPTLIYIHRGKNDPNPWQSAFMSWFASLRWYWNTKPASMVKVGMPSGFLVENPTSYRLSATDMRNILDKLRPGDILLRAYDGYLDGLFIRHSSRCAKHGYRPGWFTHVALYVGEIGDKEREMVPKSFRHDSKFVQNGSQMVLHSMAMGVHSEDILTWFRCDYLAVLRIKPNPVKAHNVTPDSAVSASPLASEPGNQQIRAALNSGAPVEIVDVLANVKMSALEKVGEAYDFQCMITDKFNRFSCAEYVYYCYRSLHDALGLTPQLHGLYPFGKLIRKFAVMTRNTVTPDDYYRLGQNDHLEIVWVDERSKRNA
jgi:hypothetical protein